MSAHSTRYLCCFYTLLERRIKPNKLRRARLFIRVFEILVAIWVIIVALLIVVLVCAPDHGIQHQGQNLVGIP